VTATTPRLLIVLLHLVCGAGAASQEPTPPPQEPPPQSPTPVPTPETGADAVPPSVPSEAERPGRFKVGGFYLTPYMRFGSIGFDSNVLYTPTERQPDFTVDGGPGLEAVLPFKRSSALTLDANVSYLYFAKTESQRRFNRSARALLELGSYSFGVPATTAVEDVFRPPSVTSVEETYLNTNARFSLEIDERVPRISEGTRALLMRPLLGRFGIELSGGRSRQRAEGEVIYLGNNLSVNLDQRHAAAGGGLRYYATIKTALVVLADYDWNRFPRAPERDSDALRVWGGIETDTTALISGHVLVGLKRFKPVDPNRLEKQSTEVDVDAMYSISPRTRLGGGYKRGLGYSYLSAPGEDPTLLTEVVEARIEKELWDRFDIRLVGRRTRLTSGGLVTIEQPDGTVVTSERNDSTEQAGFNLGYSFRPKVRVGIDATYTNRESNFAYFGIEGLIFGVTVDYIP